MKQRGNAWRPEAVKCPRKGVTAIISAVMFMYCILFGAPLQVAASSTSEAGPEPTYRVVFVATDDTLNVRSEPGADSPVVGTLPPSTSNVRITGEKRMVGAGAWFPVSAGSLKGWVAGRFLTEDISPESFCSSPPVKLLETLREAVRKKDGALLASLVHEERGLRVHVDYWNDGVRITRKDVKNLFNDSRKKKWGKDPNGDPIQGSFADIVLPGLEKDLLGATEVSCNTMNLAGASDTMQFPMGCAGINYYSYFRMPADNKDLPDWSAWVVGVEHWEGRYILSYLAHYRWEP